MRSRSSTILAVAPLLVLAACGTATNDTGDTELLGLMRSRLEVARSELQAIEGGGPYLIIDHQMGEVALKMKGTTLVQAPGRFSGASDERPVCARAVLVSREAALESMGSDPAPVPDAYTFVVRCPDGREATLGIRAARSGLYGVMYALFGSRPDGGWIVVPADHAERLYHNLVAGMSLVLVPETPL